MNMTKNRISWLTFLAVFLILYSCRQEDLLTDQKESISKTIAMQELLKADIRKFPQLQGEIQKIENKMSGKTSHNGRIYTDAEEGFSVDTEKFSFVQDANGLKSFTFKVNRTIPNNYLENLMLTDNGNGTFKTYLIQHPKTFLQGSFTSASQMEQSIESNVRVIDLGSKTRSEIFGRVNQFVCVNVVTVWISTPGVKCKDNLHTFEQGAACNYWGTTDMAVPSSGHYEYTIQDDCGLQGGAGNSTGTAGPIGTTGPYGGAGTFIDTEEELQPPKSPCETLQQMIEDQTVKNAIDALKPKTLLDKKEFAQEISRQFNGATSTYTFSTNLREGTDYGTNVSTGGFIKGNAHNHPKDGVRIPSVDDIQWLNTCQQDVTPSYVVTYNIIVCANHLTPNDYTTANLYAIATDDRDVLNTKVQDLLNRPDLVGKTEQQKKDKLMELDDLYYDGSNDNPTELEKKFLQKYGNFGLSLYRFNKTTNKWMKLTTDGNTITETPCE